jgi:hypothetical protein
MGAWQAFKAGVSAAPDPPELPEHLKPRGCERCGLVFSSGTAYDCHLEPDGKGGSRCMPPSRLAGPLLTEVDGVWCLSGFER